MAKTMSLEISDTLSAFKFSSDPDSMPDFATLVGLKDDFEGPSAQLDDFNPTGEAHDFFGDEDFDAGGGMGGGFDDSASMGGYDDQAEGFAGPSGNGGGLAMVGSGEGYGPFDPRRQGGELVMALVPGQDEDGMFDYFDKGFGKSWAGAEHWKLKKVSRKGESLSTQNSCCSVYRIANSCDRRRCRRRRSQSCQDSQSSVHHRLQCALDGGHIVQDSIRPCAPLIADPTFRREGST
jgi:hypothetical protein